LLITIFFFVFLPLVFAACYAYFEYTCFRIKRNKGNFVLLYGGGFLSKQTFIYQLLLLIYLSINCCTIILYFSGILLFTVASAPPFVGLIITPIIIYILTVRYVQISDGGILFGNEFVDWENIKGVVITDNVDSISNHLYSHTLNIQYAQNRKVTAFIPSRKLQLIIDIIESNRNNLSLT